MDTCYVCGRECDLDRDEIAFRFPDARCGGCGCDPQFRCSDLGVCITCAQGMGNPNRQHNLTR